MEAGETGDPTAATAATVATVTPEPTMADMFHDYVREWNTTNLEKVHHACAQERMRKIGHDATADGAHDDDDDVLAPTSSAAPLASSSVRSEPCVPNDMDDLWQSFEQCSIVEGSSPFVQAAAASPPRETMAMARLHARGGPGPPPCTMKDGHEKAVRDEMGGGGEMASDAHVESIESFCEACLDELRVPCDGYMTCQKCGDVGVSCIDSSAEWRYYGQEDSKSFDPSRCGGAANYLIPGSGLGTAIRRDRWKRESYRMRCARQFHDWNSLSYKGRNLYTIFDRLQQLAHKNGINNMITEHAKALYKRVTDMQLFRGENKEGLIANCMYRACKEKNVPRSIKEIAQIFGCDEHVMTKGNRAFCRVWHTIQQEDADARREAALAECGRRREQARTRRRRAAKEGASASRKATSAPSSSARGRSTSYDASSSNTMDAARSDHQVSSSSGNGGGGGGALAINDDGRDEEGRDEEGRDEEGCDGDEHYDVHSVAKDHHAAKCSKGASGLSDPTASLSQPIHYVERFCSKLDIPNRIVQEIRIVARAVHANRLIADNTSSSVAAAIIFLLASMRELTITKEDVSRASQISEVTIGKCFKKLVRYQTILEKFLLQSAVD